MRLFQILVSAVQTTGHDVGVPGNVAVNMGQQRQAPEAVPCGPWPWPRALRSGSGAKGIANRQPQMQHPRGGEDQCAGGHDESWGTEPGL